MSTSPDRPVTSPRRAFPSDVTRSARRREQLERERAAAREAADPKQLTLDLANLLDALAGDPRFAAIPEQVTSVHKLALSIRTRGNATPDRDADAVLYAMSKPLPARLLSEIVTDTGLLKDDVKKILDGLLDCGMARKVATPRGYEFWPTGTRKHADVLP